MRTSLCSEKGSDFIKVLLPRSNLSPGAFAHPVDLYRCPGPHVTGEGKVGCVPSLWFLGLKGKGYGVGFGELEGWLTIHNSVTLDKLFDFPVSPRP